MAFHRAMEWHEGEEAIHNLTGVNRIVGDNPTSSFLQPRAAHMAARYPLMALGTTTTNPTTNKEEIWCTVWGGQAPFAQQIAPSVLGIRTTVDTKFDPVVEALFGGKVDGEVMREDEENGGRLMAALPIHLEERGRMKMAGRVVAGACTRHKDNDAGSTNTDGPSATGAGEAQLVLKITQSLGNCPKYLNRKTITPAVPNPRLLESGPLLGPHSLSLIQSADLFFLASAHKHEDMDCNHRGGPPGFLRTSTTTLPNTSTQASTLTWPEYSGNNLYQTLGNLHTSPDCGICIPDFTTGSVLYLSGTTEILIGKSSSDILTHSSLAVRFTVLSSRLVAEGLPFRGTPIPETEDKLLGRSPYNPRIRYLVSENRDPNSNTAADQPSTTASLIVKKRLTPSITRYRLALSSASAFGPWKPGQYLALDFSDELDMGYSHMRDDDPGSLNDDFIRNFTVSSAPGSLGVHGEEFEVTVRKVGRVTGWLASPLQRVGMVEVGVLGFGGEFVFDFGPDSDKKVGFVSAGIGITPLLGQLGMLLEEGKNGKKALIGNVHTMWSLGIRDVGLLADVLKQYPRLVTEGALHVFLSGDESVLEDDKEGQRALTEVLALVPSNDSKASTRAGLKITRGRLTQRDLLEADKGVDEWYLCTAPAMREQVQSWLPERAFVWENFNY